MTQKEIILKHLEEHKTITTSQAIMDYGITRLATRVWELINDENYNIYKRTVCVKTRYGKKTSIVIYSMYKDKEVADQLELFN